LIKGNRDDGLAKQINRCSFQVDKGENKMHFAEVVNFTQLNLVQVAAQGYTAETEKKLSDTPSPAESSQQTKPNGHLSLVANTSLENREIDHELVLRAQRGDKRAFSMLVDKYQRKLARLLSRMVRDQSEIEDILQDTFIKAYRALPNFRGDSAFYTWLYRIGINTAKNYLVSLKRRPSVSTGIELDDAENFEDGDELRTMETPESSMMTKQIAQTVNDTVAGLPEELRTAITLREIEGLSYEEIATVMNCPIGTVRSRIFRARDTISLKLKPLLENTPDNKRW
jgi:RNA polymerase sigma-70 factor (ECF subfamily)